MKLIHSAPLDYEKIGLVVGLEVHQQLLTDHKMFCKCPAGLYTNEHDGTVLRHMRPTLSELGEYDGTALMEFKTRKNIIYLLHHSNTCTYEMDDTPPFLVNQQALDVAIEQCLMLGCDIIDEVHIARKQYLDGSIPTGFQRTAIVGVNGKLPFRGRELSVTQVSVEEDSCREVSDQAHLIVWRTDRLGMPLIETVTGPDLRTPEEVEEAILLIGRVCRSTRHVRTGPGASRQDVNVSVAGGRRVEIKGVPYAWLAPALVHSEAWRQVNLLRLRDELHQRGFTKPEDIVVEHADVTELCAESNLKVLREEIWQKHIEHHDWRPGFELGKGRFCVRAVKLPGLNGTLNWPTQPDLIFADELRGRLRVIAGLSQQPILVQSEKWPVYKDSRQEMRQLLKRMRCGADDSLVVIWGPEQDTLTAVEEIRLRYVDALDGVPHETRQPLPDGTTDFERILPGPDRMYPDTDSPPTMITRERVEGLQADLPSPPWERYERYRRAGLPDNTIFYLIRRNGADLVDEIVAKTGADLRRVGFFFGEELKGLARAGVNVEAIGSERWLEFFSQAQARPLIWEDRRQVLRTLAAEPEADFEDLLDDLETGAPRDWQRRLDDVLATEYIKHGAAEPEKRQRYYLGVAMNELRGMVLVADVAQALKERFNG
ncbi:Glu-tRNA(Gln) amidotransferase subunit GatE [bacterium]|nr:Glu-tRNA(Gln) amidotransferase subunit GatE [bacterium]